ncbi:G-protein coupled receptor GRL101-like protein [Trichoplax sp. H2]|nr:G-protein coupled receptor GRL101-like protein [Trichoplax sp. H2]|eukprot:RDD39837.1 G-protein coupled receptor GRL101-like protein [Trichoplax sp. H2]
MSNFSLYSPFMNSDSSRIIALTVVLIGLPVNLFLIGYIIISECFICKLPAIGRDRCEHMRKPSLWLLFNLLVCDLIGVTYITIIVISDAYYTQYYQHKYQHLANVSYSLIKNEWFKTTACSFAQFLSKIYLCMSSTLTLLIAVDRFMLIVYPYNRRKLTIKKSKILTSITWIADIIMAAGIVVFDNIGKRKLSPYTFERTSNLCLGLYDLEQIYFILGLLELLYILIAYTTAFILYVHMIVTLRKSTTISRSQFRSVFDKRLQITLTFIALTSVFSFYVIAGAAIYDNINKIIVPSKIRKAISMLPFSNTAIDPLLYLIFRFRDFRTLLRKCVFSNRVNMIAVDVAGYNQNETVKTSN